MAEKPKAGIAIVLAPKAKGGGDTGDDDAMQVRLSAAKDILGAKTPEELDAALVDWCKACGVDMGGGYEE